MAVSSCPILVCPRCRGPLEARDGERACAACSLRYEVLPWGVSFFEAVPESDAAGDLEVREREAAEYESAQVRAKGASFIQMQRELAARYLADAPPGPLLDAGCGVGLMTDALLAHGRHVVGVDFSLRSLEVLAGRGLPRTTLVHADLRQLPFPGGSFAGVFCGIVIQHIPPALRIEVLAELARCLAPGGVLALTAYNRAYFDTLGLPATGTYPGGNSYWSFTFEDLRSAIEGAGLVDCAVRPLGLGLLARHHRGAFRVYQAAHAIINRVESAVHGAMPPNRPYPSQYWIVKARLPAHAPH
jgi:SAM-dependent methyltransferase